jgi:predicted nucleic acid-binding protein
MSGVFVDSNCWLYLVLHGQDSVKESRLRDRLGNRRDLVISTQVITEVAANLVKKGRMPEASLRLCLEGLREAVGVVQVVGWRTHEVASRIRDGGGFSYWDSLIVAAALESGCTELWSEDLQAGRVIDGRLAIVNPLA